jgi:site-specific DNA recombinase
LATRRRGSWTGGRPPLGFDVRDKQLVVNASEAETVRAIFQLYLEHGGPVATVAELERRGIRNKSWTNKSGKHVHGAAFDKSSLRALLTNVLYIGRIRCGDEVVNAKHEAIIDAATFDEVARALREHRRAPRANVGKYGAMLTGILRCARCGSAMTSATNTRGNRLHRYYVCQTIFKNGAAACRGSRAPAVELEDTVVSRIRAIGTDPGILTATLAAAQQARAAQQPELIAESRRIATEKSQLAGQRSNLLDALQHGGAAANAIAGRLAEVDARLGRLQQRHDEVAQQLADIANATVDESAIRDALQQFDSLWNELVPKERHRMLRLLIDEVRYDGQAGEVTMEFRDNGIRALGREATERRPA